jgi:lysophospholipase L1-like esterase
MYRVIGFLLLLTFLPAWGLADESPLQQAWPYAKAMREVAQKFKGREGVVLHIGDSITHANPYGQWARGGEGRTDADLAVLKWMHLGADDDTDGWYLARTDLPGGRSYTAAGGLTMEQLLKGGRGSHPTLAKLLAQYQPQIAVLMLGTNDVSAGRKLDDFQRNAAEAVDAILGSGCICILSTIPPHPGNPKLSAAYNEALRKLAAERQLPLIDYEREILKRRPDDWNGTLMNKNDPHPSASEGDTSSASEPTAENLRNSGYLLRGWLSVKKIGEVKQNVIDGGK